LDNKSLFEKINKVVGSSLVSDNEASLLLKYYGDALKLNLTENEVEVEEKKVKKSSILTLQP